MSDETTRLGEQLLDLAAETPPPPDFADRIIAAASEGDARPPKRHWLPVVAAAACVAIIAIGITVIAAHHSDRRPAASPSTSNQCSRPYGPVDTHPLGSDPTAVTATWSPGMNTRNCAEPVTTGDAALARDLVAALRQGSKITGTYSCAADRGAGVALHFQYATGDPVQVVVPREGCIFVAIPGGSTVSPPTTFFSLLSQLAPPDFRPTATVSTEPCARTVPSLPARDESAPPAGLSPDDVDAQWFAGGNAQGCQSLSTGVSAAIAAPLLDELIHAPAANRDEYCPADDGAGVVLNFRYADSSTVVTATVQLSGCRFAAIAGGRLVHPPQSVFALLRDFAPPELQPRLR